MIQFRKLFLYSYHLLFAYFLLIFNTSAQENLQYYLPDKIEYNLNIPEPKNIIDHEIGEWHVSHDRLVNYMQAVAAKSERITIETFGHTFEKRPLVLLTITSEENHRRIKEIKEQHLQLTDANISSSLNIEKMPAVIYMGFSIHGNEPSGSNAALALAYYLAAAEGEEINKILNNTIILLDPSLNPDGLNRFASWVNSRRSFTEVSDPQNIEQNEPWPGGRTNHYWFDLNRDWLPAQLPESQARLKKYHEWKPNVLTDHHEMGTNSTFFFQPGIPSRNNPLTPAKTFELTEKMGEYHAAALDQIGSLYYTKESFDDYYYGKGSTYPDIQGAVGILFEQASSRGHAQNSDNGVLRFPFTVRNQFTTALSSLKAISELKNEFLAHQRDFYINAQKQSRTDAEQAYIFGSNEDPARAFHLAELISMHDIKIYKPSRQININGKNVAQENSYIVPLDQPQYPLIKAMFERRTSFTDSLFYDISTWTLPLAFNLPYDALGKKYSSELLGKIFTPTMPEGTFFDAEKPYAYLFEWSHYYAPKVLYLLQKKGVKAKVATEEFINNGKTYSRGTILIPAAGQEMEKDELKKILKTLAKENSIDITAVKGGLDYGSYSLGSPSFDPVVKPEIAIFTGEGISASEAGEVWHLLDQRYSIPMTLLPIDNLSRTNLNRYNVIIMVSGSYSFFSDKDKEKLKSWISSGGTVIAQKSAINWLSNLNIGNLSFKKTIADTLSQNRRYADIQEHRGSQTTGGAIFNTTADLTHPLLFGYSETEIPIFRNHNIFLEPGKNPFSNPVVYTSSPLMSGYISKNNLNLLSNSSAVGVINYGKGKVIAFTDNHNFRAFWYGTNKMFMNGIFFSSIISRSAGR